MRRILFGSAFVLVAGVVHAQCVKPGVSRWAVKTSLPTAREEPVALTLEQITALPTPASIEGNKERATRFPDDLGNGLKEGSLVRVSGWVRLIATDPDCDYHIQLNQLGNRRHCDCRNAEPRDELRKIGRVAR
jgi:hypothetical protein